MLNLKTRKDSYICKLYKAPLNAKCRHTGFTTNKGVRSFSKSPNDGGLEFTNFGHHAKLQGSNREVIFAGNDLVEVFRG